MVSDRKVSWSEAKMDAASYAMSFKDVHATNVNIQRRLRYALAWRQRKLIVRPLEAGRSHSGLCVEVEGDRDWLLRCLDRSPTRLVLLDPAMGAADLELWAELCWEAGKPAFLLTRSWRRGRSRFGFQRLANSGVAALLLLLLSPILLSIGIWSLLMLPGSVFERCWCINMQGQLYRELRFNAASNATIFRWEYLPRLINILLGETGFGEGNVQLIYLENSYIPILSSTK